MEFQDVVARRRMVRSFQDRPVSREVVDRILRNALRAPSAGFSQGWAFLVLHGSDQTATFWDAMLDPSVRARFAWPGLLNAPLLVVPMSCERAYLDRYAEPDKGWTDRDPARWPVPYWHIDTGFAALLMLLTAVDAGLGALFFGIFEPEVFRETFGVPDDHTPVGAVAIGYPATDRPSASLRRGRRPLDDVIHWGRW